MNHPTLPRRRRSKRPSTRRPRRGPPRAPAWVAPKYCPSCQREVGYHARRCPTRIRVDRLLGRRLVELLYQGDDERAESRAEFLAGMRVVGAYDESPQGKTVT